MPPDEAPGVAWASQTNSSVPSSSVTETTDTPTQNGSPASSHTSLSVASTKDGKDFASSKEVESLEEDVQPSIPVSAEKTAVVPVTTSAAPTPSSSTASPQLVPSTSTTTSTSTPVTPPAPPPAPPKKSWASLLRPSTSTSASASGSGSSSAVAGPSRNALPTSSVVGFSIPAAASPVVQDAALHVSPSRKSELVRLLTSGPAGVGYAGALSSYASAGSVATTTNADTAPVHTATTTSSLSVKIRPRGLINSGNMCFANSVLQIMVYCPPFHRLFAELGKVLVLGGGGGGGVNGVEESSKYPLVDATVEFLREFVVVDDMSSKEKEKDVKERDSRVNGRPSSGSMSASASGSASSSRVVAAASSRSGKGKDRERGDSVSYGGYVSGNGGAGEMKMKEAAEDGGRESFLPTYVYDAMKVKKRFEHMRVSCVFFFRCFFLFCSFCERPLLISSSFSLIIFFYLTFIPSHRAATKKTLKSSLDFISIRSKKSCWRC